MISSIRIVSACIALNLLVSCTSVSDGKNDTTTRQPSAPESAWQESPEESNLRIGPGDPVAGMRKAVMCFGCHGEDGNSTDPENPKLAGQYGIYLSKQIRNYLSGRLNHQVMGSVAINIRDQDIDDISAFFASQPMMKGNAPSGNKLGKKLYENDDMSRLMVRCSNCHGTHGKGLTPENPVYPVIGGQHRDYLLYQLKKFRQGARNNSPGGVMNTTVHHLNDAELEALADYVSGL